MSYFDIYKLRLNRYGLNYQERIQNEREKLFELYLLKSSYRIDFIYKGNTYPGSFEKYKQDETETLHYLLTSLNLKMPNGTILNINNTPWMIYYLEAIQSSGYNRYIMLKMTHTFFWKSQDDKMHKFVAYFYGQQNNSLKDELKSGNLGTIYNENSKSNFLIMPRTELLKKDDYLIIGIKPYQQYFRVTGFDIQSTLGVEYVTVDPTYKYDLSSPPVQLPDDNGTDFFWINGGDISS